MSVFAKTRKGLDSLRDMNSGMPRRMRTLLWCINGQTSTGTLIRSLTSLGDVLASLAPAVNQTHREFVVNGTHTPSQSHVP
jgi:hypothetical protein